jgi:putative two-component system response regulator
VHSFATRIRIGHNAGVTLRGLSDDVDALEAALATPSTPTTLAQATSLAARFEQVSPDREREERALAVRGLLVASHEFYRGGQIARAVGLVRHAVALADDVDAGLRIRALLRCGDIELLNYDVGAALGHIALALDVARAEGRKVDEAGAWVAFGMALDWAGLYQQADLHWARALEVLEGTDEMRLRGNVWALRCPLGFRLRAGQEEAAAETCRQALACALASPPRFRDSMACTALCNWAALEVQRGRLAEARAHLDQAARYANVGTRPRWLVEVVRAMADVRESNDAPARAALDALLAPDRAPAIAYVIETFAVLAATYADMGDAVRAGETLERLSRERAKALWAMLRDQQFTAAPLARGAAPLTAGAGGEAEQTAALLVRLAVTAELRDDATGKHCFRVGRIAMLLGRRAGLPEADLEGLELAARLHDIGKLVIPDAILLKPGALDATELHLMRSHTVMGADILASSTLPSIDAARAIARHHHERWDGRGYPDGIAGESIPLAARVAALADVFDALTHERPYKHAWTVEAALDYIASMRGTQFDPRLTDLFVAMMEEARVDLESFLRDIESVAAASPYVAAQSRLGEVLGGGAAG